MTYYHVHLWFLFLSVGNDLLQQQPVISLYDPYTYSGPFCTNITILEDTILEYNEVFKVILTSAFTIDQRLSLPYNNNAYVTIYEDGDSKYACKSL